jgi:hypothetical protein
MCHCRKSQCRKGYCECFAAGVACGPLCKCRNCTNCDTADAELRRAGFVKEKSGRARTRWPCRGLGQHAGVRDAGEGPVMRELQAAPPDSPLDNTRTKCTEICKGAQPARSSRPARSKRKFSELQHAEKGARMKVFLTQVLKIPESDFSSPRTSAHVFDFCNTVHAHAVVGENNRLLPGASQYDVPALPLARMMSLAQLTRAQMRIITKMLRLAGLSVAPESGGYGYAMLCAELHDRLRGKHHAHSSETVHGGVNATTCNPVTLTNHHAPVRPVPPPWPPPTTAITDPIFRVPDAARCQLEGLLSEQGLLHHMSTLVQHDLDVHALRCCNDADLSKIGLPIGARKKLLAVIKSDAASTNTSAQFSLAERQ